MKHPKSSNLATDAINKNTITLNNGKTIALDLLSIIEFLSIIKGKYPIIIGTIMIYIQELISRTPNSTKILKIKA